MYFISVAGRNYNIAIRVRAALGGVQAVFESRLESCTGPLTPITCDVDINYHYEDVAANSGNRTITLLSGNSSVSEQPTGNTLTVLYVNSLTGYGCTAYNTVYDCPGPLPTTTTSTTTAPTTTTTTTIAPVNYSTPLIKQDQYSSSLSSGVWQNIGTGGSTYNIFISSGNINTGGSGTGVFLGLTGSIDSEYEESIFPALYGDIADLYNKSFSWAAVFRIESTSLGSSIFFSSAFSNLGVVANGFGLSSGFDTSPYIKPYVFKPGSDPYGPTIRISSTPKWYLGVLTFDKNGTSSTAGKFYLNTTVTSFTGLSAIPSPSTFFVSGPRYVHNIARSLNPIKLAATIYWDNVVLTQAQIQTLYNEYNTRYGLG